MALHPISFRWDEEFVARIDAARGSVPRSTFVRQALEAALSGDTQAASPAGRSSGHSHTGSTASAIGAVPARGASRPAASPRAPARNVAPRVHHPRCACPICKPPKKAKR